VPGVVREDRHPVHLEGSVVTHLIDSEVLRGNALGDPQRRELPVYLPPVSDPAGLPAILCLAGFTGRGEDAIGTHPWRPGIVQRHDRAIAAGEAAPALLVLPDCFTRLGGSQYVNSSATGRYADHLIQEVLPFIEAQYGISPRAWSVVGKSSGGFGALHLAMHHPGVFQAVASISGDCDFEALFAGELLACLRGLVPHGMDPARFLAAFDKKPDLDGDGHAVLMVLAMAACYSPNPDAPLGFDLPIDLETGSRIDDVWARWLAFDPLQAAPAHAEALGGLRLLHLECGLADEFHLQWGLRKLVRLLADLDIACEHEEHDGGHRGIDHRWPAVLSKLAQATSSTLA